MVLDVALDVGGDLPAQITRGSILDLVTFALGEEGAVGDWEINIRFVPDGEIQRLHAQFMNQDSPTDIMTFPIDPNPYTPAEVGGRGGDIVISVDTAAVNSGAAGWPLEDELLFLVLHGVLHLRGWDDHDDMDRAAMLGRQDSLLTRWRQAGTGAG